MKTTVSALHVKMLHGHMHGKEVMERNFFFLRRFSFGGSLFLEVPKQAITNMATVHLLGQIGIGITERKKNENMVTHY